MKIQDFKIHSQDRLDVLLADCVEELFRCRRQDPVYWGLVSAAILDPDGNIVHGVNHLTKQGTRKHAERVAIENYEKKHGQVPAGSIIVTTLSPCSDDMSERWGESCTDLINNSHVKKVYSGWKDPYESDTDQYRHKKFTVRVTKNPRLLELCRDIGKIIIDKSKNS